MSQKIAITEESAARPSKSQFLLMGLMSGAGLWILICAISAAWLKQQVSLTEGDLATASWLGSYTTSTHFTGVFGLGLACTVGLMGAVIALVRRTVFPLLMGGLMALCLWQASSLDTAARVGIYNGGVKIGCYSYESKECLEMLRLPSNSAPSRYADKDATELYAPWYLKAVPQDQVSFLDFIPGGYFIQAPFVVAHIAELNRKISEERKEVAALRASKALASR